MPNTIPFEEREEQLVNWCKDQTHWYQYKSVQQGKRLRLFRALVLFFSVSVLSGIPEVKNVVPWSITVAAALSTFFAGLLTISKTEEAFANYMLSAGQFRRELLLYHQETGLYAGLEPEKQLLLLTERHRIPANDTSRKGLLFQAVARPYETRS